MMSDSITNPSIEFQIRIPDDPIEAAAYRRSLGYAKYCTGKHAPGNSWLTTPEEIEDTNILADAYLAHLAEQKSDAEERARLIDESSIPYNDAEECRQAAMRMAYNPNSSRDGKIVSIAYIGSLVAQDTQQQRIDDLKEKSAMLDFLIQESLCDEDPCKDEWWMAVPAVSGANVVKPSSPEEWMQVIRDAMK